jgi:hypothetical protein
MSVLDRFAAGIAGHSRRQLTTRSLLAAPFAASLVLTLAMGPAIVENGHASFVGLAALSLIFTVLIFGAPLSALSLIGAISFVVFPLLVGLGFELAPDWTRPVVAVVFYGSILASIAATLGGIAAIIDRFRGRRRHASSMAAVAGASVLAAGVLLGVLPATSRAGGPASAPAAATSMGPVINTAQREAEPTFTADGRTMVFNCRDYEICISHLSGAWAAGEWTQPELIGLPISSDYLEVEPWISAAGDKLYFNSTRPFARGEALPGLALYVDIFGLIAGRLAVAPLGGVGQDEIWVSYLVDGAWSEPRNVNDMPDEPPVNTAYMDHCLDFSDDGQEAFWTSTRPGGLGGNDIWTSHRVDGSWTAPENLGTNINSPANEHHSMPSADGRSLHVTSDRPGGYGGQDIYVAKRGAGGEWGTLTNGGAQVNGPSNDRCNYRTPDGTIFVFDSDRPGGFGGKDLWWIEFEHIEPAFGT